MSDTTVPTVGYFKMRGRAQPIRLLLAYKGVKFIDKYYDPPGADTPESYRVEWHKQKFTLGFDFPDVPYYVEGSIKLTHSMAIMRHLARKHGLVATDETGLTRQDVLEQQLTDIRNGFWGVLYPGAGYEIDLLFNNEYVNEKVKYIAETLPKQLNPLSRFLGTRQWFTGNHINYVDFLAYELLDWFRLFSAGTVDKYQNLIQFLTRFESLPAIKAFMKSPEFISWPIDSPNDIWGFEK
ncbi:unnamed protein product [Medioppia subpectinata]|uniref:glutathione transferase n=1 Tax=Medioppia subpectinata TaxID=1979941 RepID=A0A7R9L309_9ACAR|nr:unnamed protein product [Medioppia subpectinata]CAG2114478.1 unnamed protein product [Medioppia subpectinata]